MLIIMEGIDGAGKSTQATLLHRRLQDMGKKTILVREPGTSSLGERLRAVTRETQMTHLAEGMLFCAARAELYATSILPALTLGWHVVCDRGPASTLAYQGYGYGGDDMKLRVFHLQMISYMATENRVADLSILLDISPKEALKRKGVIPTNDKFETSDLEFRARVREGYRTIVRQAPITGHWRTILATPSVAHVEAAVWAAVRCYEPITWKGLARHGKARSGEAG